MPVHTNLVRPIIEETFWVCLLGKGYPAPSNTFRWCTDRLKISSANRFIQDQVSEYGEVIMALGSRKDESSTRAQVLNTHHIKGTKLSRHSTLPSACHLSTHYVIFTVKISLPSDSHSRFIS